MPLKDRKKNIARLILTWIKRHPKKTVFLALLTIVQLLNFNRFCYSEFDFLSNEELIQRGLGGYYKENPYCCEITPSGKYIVPPPPLWLHYLRMFFGLYLMETNALVHRYLPDKEEPYNHEYRAFHRVVDACGRKRDSSGYSFDKEEYETRLAERKKRIQQHGY